MPYLLRQIRYEYWIDLGTDEPKSFTWLPSDQACADAVYNLHSKKNVLSFWKVEDDRSNIQVVLSGIASGRDNVDEFAYVLIKEQSVKALGLNVEVSMGDVPDTEARAYHRDITQLSANNLAALANLIHSGGEFGQWRVEDQLDTLVPRYTQKKIVNKGLKPGLKERLKKEMALRDS